MTDPGEDMVQPGVGGRLPSHKIPEEFRVLQFENPGESRAIDRRRRPVRVAIGPDGVGVQLRGASAPLRATGPRARVLGRSVVLHWRGAEGTGTMWLTPLDLPRGALRAARVRILAARAAVAG